MNRKQRRTKLTEWLAEWQGKTEMTPEELGRTLNELERVEKWAKEVRQTALELALQGTEIPGWGIAYSTTKRRYTDREAVIRKVQEMGMDPFEQVLKGVPEMEKMMGTYNFEKELGALVERPVGNAKLVKIEREKNR